MQFILTPDMLQQIATAAAMAAVQGSQPTGEKTKLTALPDFTGKENVLTWIDQVENILRANEIFKFKRLNHFKQRMQSLSVLLQNQKANQNDIVNLFTNKSRGSNERALRCLSSKCISITNQFVQVIYQCHLSKLTLVIESHELMNKGYLSVINYGWKDDSLQVKATARLFCVKIISSLRHLD
jgi:hypothetical protein